MFYIAIPMVVEISKSTHLRHDESNTQDGRSWLRPLAFTLNLPSSHLNREHGLVNCAVTFTSRPFQHAQRKPPSRPDFELVRLTENILSRQGIYIKPLPTKPRSYKNDRHHLKPTRNRRCNAVCQPESPANLASSSLRPLIRRTPRPQGACQTRMFHFSHVFPHSPTFQADQFKLRSTCIYFLTGRHFACRTQDRGGGVRDLPNHVLHRPFSGLLFRGDDMSINNGVARVL